MYIYISRRFPIGVDRDYGLSVYSWYLFLSLSLFSLGFYTLFFRNILILLAGQESQGMAADAKPIRRSCSDGALNCIDPCGTAIAPLAAALVWISFSYLYLFMLFVIWSVTIQ